MATYNSQWVHTAAHLAALYNIIIYITRNHQNDFQLETIHDKNNF